MARGIKEPSSIINYVELVFALIVGGLIGDIQVSDTVSKQQVIHMVAYGYLIISIIVVASILLKEEIPQKVRLMIAGSAIIMYITCGALLLEYADKYGKVPDFFGMGQSIKAVLGPSDLYDRTMAAGIFSIFLALLYIADAYFAFKSK